MRFLYFLILIVVFVSCKKDPIKYVLLGNTSDLNSGSSINQVLVKISQKEVNVNVLNPNFLPVGETYTDINGDYSFIFDREKILELKFELKSDNYYSTSKTINSSELSTENDNVFDFKMESRAWIKIRLINDFAEQSEQLNFYKHNVREDCPDCCSTGYTIVTHQTPDTTFICPVVGDLPFKYSYGEVQAGTSVTDSIYCTKGDTTNLVIIY
jgi:hypothetical protein